jgi:hypothetical protein
VFVPSKSVDKVQPKIFGISFLGYLNAVSLKFLLLHNYGMLQITLASVFFIADRSPAIGTALEPNLSPLLH